MSNNQAIKQGADAVLEGCLHTSSEDLSKLVSWAHSHGTICTVIPSLKHLLTEGSHGRLTAMWGCCAGHAYHWAFSSACATRAKEPACIQDGRGVHYDSSQLCPGDRVLSRGHKVKRDCAPTREACGFSNCSEPSEGDYNNEEYGSALLDIVCESSATDEDADYEAELQHTPRAALRKRAAPRLSHAQACHQRSEEGAGDSAGKKIKQETFEDYYSVAVAQLTGPCDGGSSSFPASHSAKSAQTHAPVRLSLSHRPPAIDLNSPLTSSLHSPHVTLVAKPLRSPVPSGQSRALGSGPSSSPIATPQRPPGGGSESGQCVQSPLSSLQLPGHNELEPLSAEELMKTCASSEPYADMDVSPGTANAEVNMSTDPNTETSGAPALFEIERLKVLLQAERSKSELMGETIKSLKQDKELLQQELTKKAELICDFLQDQLSHRPEKRRCHVIGQPEPSGSSQQSAVYPDEAPAFESPTLFDSFDEMETQSNERQKTIKLSKRSREGENTRVRMKNVVGVIARYMTALQEFRRSVSMKVAFDRVGVDRNTISRTAAIAELSLAAPEVFHSLPPWDEKEETLAHYAIRCRQAMDDNIKAKIKIMKAKGDLLPIVSK